MPDGKVAIRVGEVVGAVAEATGLSRKKVLEGIARRLRLTNTTESDPTRETIMSYLRPRTEGHGGEATPCHYKFANAVMYYVAASSQLQSQPPKILNNTALSKATSLCRQVLRQERAARYETGVRSDPVAGIDALDVVGVYAVVRRESKTSTYVHDLLILQSEGNRNRQCRATYLNSYVVARGDYMVVRKSICCHLTGLRKDRRADAVAIHLAEEGTDLSLLAGAILGIGTSETYPVVAPVVAVRVPASEQTLGALTDLDDITLMQAMADLATVIDPALERKLVNVLEQPMPAVVLSPGRLTSPLRGEFHDPLRQLVGKGITEFCLSDHACLLDSEL